MTILHKSIVPVLGDPDYGVHVLHYYQFDDYTDMSTLTDSSLGALVGPLTPGVADVGRVAKVGMAVPYTFHLLVSVGPVEWTAIGDELPMWSLPADKIVNVRSGCQYLVNGPLVLAAGAMITLAADAQLVVL